MITFNYNELTMANIHIKKTHTLDKESVKKEIQNLAEELSEEMSAEYNWQGDRLVFKRSGASCTIDISDSEVDIEVKLSMILSPMKGKIEKTINSYFDKYLG